MTKDISVRDPAGQALAASPSSPVPGLAPTGFDPSRGLIVKRWEVAVVGYGAAIYIAHSRGAALADAWRCDAFNGYTYAQFMRIARCQSAPVPPRWGDVIEVGGKTAFFLENNSQYVRFVYPNSDVVLNSHPYDVEPEEYRPSSYRAAQGMSTGTAKTPQAAEGEACQPGSRSECAQGDPA